MAVIRNKDVSLNSSTTEIDPNDMKWQIWKELGQEKLNIRKKLKIY